MMNIPTRVLDELELVVLDSDGVCIPRGTVITEEVVDGRYSNSISTYTITPSLAGKITELMEYAPVMISSGRSLLYLQVIYRDVEGIILMGENGSVAMTSHGHIYTLLDLPPGYRHLLMQIREGVSTLPGVAVEPKAYILTIHSPEEYTEVYDIVREYDYDGILQVMWNGEAWDIQLQDVSKGTGIVQYASTCGISTENIMGIGDRINDRALLDAVGTPVSADIDELDAPYWTTGDGLPGEELVDYLLSYYGGKT